MGIFHIAIDGPSGAGKSTVAKALAKRLNIAYLDTGAMYRTVGLYMHNNGVEIEPDAVEAALSGCNIEVLYNNGEQIMLLNGENVNGKIREHYVSSLASRVSAIPCVRIFLVALQQKIAKGQSFVLDGRDIGTCVLPDAKYKFFLTASSSERARRRCAELEQKGQSVDYEQILADIEKRDYDDSHRAMSPLRQADDAVLVDSTDMQADQVIDHIAGMIKE